MWKFGKKDSQADTIEEPKIELNAAQAIDENSLGKRIVFVCLFLFFAFYLLGVYWSVEPDLFDVKDSNAYRVSNASSDKKLIVGYTLLATTEKVATTLLEKNGGYLSNDILPPSVFLDNMPSWEFGVLVQVRDIVSSLRNDMSRSQSQSLENVDLKQSEPLFNNDHAKWILPSAESKYKQAVEKLANFRQDLSRSDKPNVQFFARADNLNTWLETVNKRLGGLSQRLSASVAQERENTDLAGDSVATQSTQTHSSLRVKTPWLQIDNTFYEARGSCWALIHLLKAAQVDFEQVLKKKNASASLAQVIRELEASQANVWSPVILNGSGFGLLANHSLVMANYISRANAGLIDLRELLTKG
ncbi:MAG: DUF2333 family protein [Enterobacterales bacterium]|nr:DUF2333 family protein [Enterobacterales bacterium]